MIKSNFHTHSTFCDGKNTPEEVVINAIEKGFLSIGFSSHAYTEFDLRYCMKDTEGYIAEINRLKNKYKDQIQIYLGVEEDAFQPVDRRKFDYIIGSSHYFHVNNKYLPIDSNREYFIKCLEEFNYNIPLLTETYYSTFCDYIVKRKPDIIGHFDLITKFDELSESLFLNNKEYNNIAEKYIKKIASLGCYFEVNTGAIARNLRTSPYPKENLLYILKKHGTGLVLASDSHVIDTLDFQFEDIACYLREIGFDHLFYIYNNKFEKYKI